MKTILSIAIVLILLSGLVSCKKDEMPTMKTQTVEFPKSDKQTAVTAYVITPKPDIRDVYLDRHTFTISVRPFNGPGAEELVAQTPVVNLLFVYDDKQILQVPEKKLISITDAVQPTHNPTVIWKEYVIRFGRGATIQQFFSVQDLEAAVNESRGQILVTETGNVYEGRLLSLTKEPGANMLKD